MGRFLLFKIIGVLSVISIQVVVPTVAAEEIGKPAAISQVVAKNQTSNKNATLKCTEIPHVKFDDATTCPSEGKFLYIDEDVIDCNLFVECKCQGGRMTALADTCEDNETFTGQQCFNNTDLSKEMMCPQQKCKMTEIPKPINHSLSHNCPKVELEDYPGDEHSHGHDHHNHNHESTTKASVSNPTHALSSTIVPFFHSVILMLVASLVL